MKQGSIEKSAQLSDAKVVLGHVGVTAYAEEIRDAAPEFSRQHAIDSLSSNPVPSPRERIAELEAELAASAQRIDELQQQLQELQQSEAEQRSALRELQDGLSAAQQNAEQRGYADGSAAGEQAVREEWQQQLAAWEQGIAALADQHCEHLTQLQATVADIALAATAKIIGAQLTDAQQIGKAVEHIIYESGLAGAMKVFLAPSHYEELMRAGGITLQRLGSRQLELQPDPRVAYGGCLLEAASAVVDGRYEVQLKKLQAIVSEFHPTVHSGADENADADREAMDDES